MDPDRMIEVRGDYGFPELVPLDVETDVINARTHKLKGEWTVEITQGKTYDYSGVGLKPTLWERISDWWRRRPPFLRPWF